MSVLYFYFSKSIGLHKRAHLIPTQQKLKINTALRKAIMLLLMFYSFMKKTKNQRNAIKEETDVSNSPPIHCHVPGEIMKTKAIT